MTALDETTPRDIWLRMFNNLAQEFQACLDYARQNESDLIYALNACCTRSDLQAIFGLTRMEALGGTAHSNLAMLGALGSVVHRGTVSNRVLADLCGYNLIPQVAAITVDACRAGFFPKLPRLWRAVHLDKCGRLDDHHRMRTFWSGTILPDLRYYQPRPFAAHRRSPWAPILDNTIACNQLFELVRGEANITQSIEPSKPIPDKRKATSKGKRPGRKPLSSEQIRERFAFYDSWKEHPTGIDFNQFCSDREMTFEMGNNWRNWCSKNKALRLKLPRP